MSHHKLSTCPLFVPSTEDVMIVLVFCLYLSTNDRDDSNQVAILPAE